MYELPKNRWNEKDSLEKEGFFMTFNTLEDSWICPVGDTRGESPRQHCHALHEIIRGIEDKLRECLKGHEDAWNYLKADYDKVKIRVDELEKHLTQCHHKYLCEHIEKSTIKKV